MNLNISEPIVTFDSERLSHAYIVNAGLEDSLAMAAVCSASGSVPCLKCAHCRKAQGHIHPDIIFVKKPEDKREYPIDQIRGLKEDVVVVPNESARKVYIIYEACTLGKAQNTLLQMLEEPPSFAVFILSTDNPAALLETVRSRCIKLNITQKQADSDPDSVALAKSFIAALSVGNMEIAETMFLLEKLNKNDFTAFLAAAQESLAAEMRDAALDGQSDLLGRYSLAENLLLKAVDYLNFNVNIGHITGMLCAELVT